MDCVLLQVHYKHHKLRIAESTLFSPIFKQHCHFSVSLRLSLSPFSSSLCSKLTEMAVSKTAFRFFCVKAEHSANAVTPRLRPTSLASSTLGGCSRCRASWMRTCTSSRRSDCVPTRTMGATGLRRRTSGAQRSLTLWKEEGWRCCSRAGKHQRHGNRTSADHQVRPTRGAREIKISCATIIIWKTKSKHLTLFKLQC